DDDGSPFQSLAQRTQGTARTNPSRPTPGGRKPLITLGLGSSRPSGTGRLATGLLPPRREADELLAGRGAPSAAGQELRAIPSFFMRASRGVRLSPRIFAAPRSPPPRHPGLCRTARM